MGNENEEKEYCPLHLRKYEQKYPWSEKICQECELNKTL
jgi:hypothetical protein